MTESPTDADVTHRAIALIESSHPTTMPEWHALEHQVDKIAQLAPHPDAVWVNVAQALEWKKPKK